MNEIEIVVNIFLQSLGSFLILPMQIISFLGTEEFFLLVLTGVYWCYNAGLGMRIGVVLLWTNGINGLFKLAFHSPRPYWVDTRVQAYAGDPSFGIPSGHSQTSASVWGLVATAFKQRWVKITAVAIIFLVGFSRLYLGVHYLSDVLAGWLFGLLILWLFLKLEKPVLNRVKGRSLPVQVGLVLLSSLVMIGIGLLLRLALNGWQMPADWAANAARSGVEANPLSLDGTFSFGGIWFGTMAGLAWYYRRYGMFRTEGTPLLRIGRYVLGVAGVMVCWFVLGKVFPRGDDALALVLRFLRYALIGVWVTAIAPWLYVRLKMARCGNG
jgi:membrane-associated phospholipid phosphatase